VTAHKIMNYHKKEHPDSLIQYRVREERMKKSKEDKPRQHMASISKVVIPATKPQYTSGQAIVFIVFQEHR